MDVIVSFPVLNRETLAIENRDFAIHGYGDPMELCRDSDGYTLSGYYVPDSKLPVWYLNSAGYAQILNEARPPARYNGSRNRLLLIPVTE